MRDSVIRFNHNPILTPDKARASRDNLVVQGLFNPGVFRYQGRTGLLVRVAEGLTEKQTTISVPIIDPNSASGIKVLDFQTNDPDFRSIDSRKFNYKDKTYLTTLSHLRLAWSDDNLNFTLDQFPTLTGEGQLETFGIEDPRVVKIDGSYLITYTQVSPNGNGVGLISTTNWQKFERHGMILPPTNKDCAIFPTKINDQYVAFHRPTSLYFGSNYIWLGFSPDLSHWGNHKCVVWTRPNMWDEERIGVGPAPIQTADGWLVIYHGANKKNRYSLGAMLFELKDPTILLARSAQPLMGPEASYEEKGFFDNVIFANGCLVDGDKLTLYYGAADKTVCGAYLSIKEILASLKPS